MKAFKLIAMLLAVFVLVAVCADPAAAQEKQGAAAAMATGFFGSAFGKGVGAGLVIIGAGLGFGKIGSAALESMARQPETAGKVQTAMIIIGALLEGATFFALIVCMGA